MQPCAYLHNYTEDGVLTDPFYAEYLALAPVFLKGEAEREKLRKFIRRHVKYGDTAQLLYRLDHGRIRPSKGLVEALGGMLAGKQEFVLVDDQKAHLRNRSASSRQSDSGKQAGGYYRRRAADRQSLVAIKYPLAHLNARQQLLAKYVTRNAAPRKSVRECARPERQKHADLELVWRCVGYTSTVAPMFLMPSSWTRRTDLTRIRSLWKPGGESGSVTYWRVQALSSSSMTRTSGSL